MRSIHSNDRVYSRSVTADDTDPNGGGMSHHYRVTQQWDDRSPEGAERTFVVDFQHGPVLQAGHNGLQHADLYRILIDRLECVQAGPFACSENAEQIDLLRSALSADEARTARRIAARTEGTNSGT